jgi:hypothetical protein
MAMVLVHPVTKIFLKAAQKRLAFPYIKNKIYSKGRDVRMLY